MSRPGDANLITREYFDSIYLEMRHLDSAMPSTELTLYGETFATPIMTAALSHLDRFRENGMVELARGAYMAGAANWAGMGSESELENIISTGAKTVKIIKPHADNKIIFDKIEHAEKAGAFALGMDIDHAFNPRGEYGEVRDMPMRPKSAAELKEFVAASKLPFIIKGVLSEKDAEKCVEIGVGGIVVSHHHGMMDFAIPPLMILPEIARIVDGKFPIFVDCCLESGMDAFKALALGATAVCVGRALIKPLEKDGADGVAAGIREMTSQLKGAMARTGYSTLDEIDESCIWLK